MEVLPFDEHQTIAQLSQAISQNFALDLNLDLRLDGFSLLSSGRTLGLLRENDLVSVQVQAPPLETSKKRSSAVIDPQVVLTVQKRPRPSDFESMDLGLESHKEKESLSSPMKSLDVKMDDQDESDESSSSEESSSEEDESDSEVSSGEETEKENDEDEETLNEISIAKQPVNAAPQIQQPLSLVGKNKKKQLQNLINHQPVHQHFETSTASTQEKQVSSNGKVLMCFEHLKL
jgi:hypothetical protein